MFKNDGFDFLNKVSSHDGTREEERVKLVVAAAKQAVGIKIRDQRGESERAVYRKKNSRASDAHNNEPRNTFNKNIHTTEKLTCRSPLLFRQLFRFHSIRNPTIRLENV